MSPRTGRPKIDNPKSNDIKVRVDDKTIKSLDEYCKAKNLTKAGFIRQAIKEKMEREP